MRLFGNLFKPWLLNSKGEADTGGEGQGEGNQGGQGEGGEEKKYADIYKSVPELEEGYKNSQREYTRVSGENETLRTRVQQYEQKEAEFRQSQEKAPVEEDYSQTFDKDAVETIRKISRKEAQGISRESLSGYEKLNTFQKRLASGWEKAQSEYGPEFEFVVDGKVNPNSELYKKADGILTEKYVNKLSDGTTVFTNADAHYLAVTEAYAGLVREGKANKPSSTSRDKRQRLSNLSGKGGPSSGKGTLTRDQYLALTPEKQDAYDRDQVKAQGGLTE